MPRFLPPSFARDQEGHLHIARGDRNVQRWDGIASSPVDSGVPAPSSAITVGTSGNGTIVGRIYAYQRWVDADGRVSNLSPVSTVHEPAALSGSVTGATNASPIVITSNAHGLSNGDTVKIVGVLGNTAANGLWTTANVAANTFELTNSIGNGVYAAGGTWKKGRQTVNYTNVSAPSDSRVVRRQILRNKDGDVKTFYIDVSTTDLSSTSFNSTNTDADLGAAVAVALVGPDGNDLAVSVNSEPPNWKRSIVHHKGRMWLAGQWTYTEGAVILTNGSATITGIQTNWTSAMVGWEFWPAGYTRSYTISSVNTSAQTAVLETTYGGSSDAFSYYAMTPPVFNSQGGGERRTIYFSEAGKPCSFDLGKSLTLPEEKDGGDITGLISYNNLLLVAFDRRLVRLSFSVRPHVDAQPATVLYRGLVTQNAVVQADGSIYLMDRRGIYLFAGNSDQDISAPIRPMFDGTATKWRINWRRAEYFHAAHFPEDATLKFFVVLTGGVYPQHALCYHYRQQRWWIEEYPVPILSSCSGELNGRSVVFLGTTGRRVLLANEGCLDGISAASPLTLRGTVTSAGFESLADSTANFSSSLVGLSVRIVAGTGAGQQRTIYAVSGTTLKVDQPWLVKPDTTSVYQIGGIKWTYRTGWFRWVPSQTEAARGLDVVFEPTAAASRLAANLFSNLSSTADVFKDARTQNGMTTAKDSSDLVIDTTQAEGHARQELASTRSQKTFGREKVRVLLTGVPNTERQKVYEVNVEGAAGR